MPLGSLSAGILFFLNTRLVAQDHFELYRSGTLEHLRQVGVDDLREWVITDDASAKEANRALRDLPADLLILAFPSWIDEGLPLVALDGYTGAGLLWSDYEGLALAGLSGVVSTSSNLLRIGRPMLAIIGPLERAEIRSEILAFAAAAKVKQALRDVRVGSVGTGCPGMLGVDFDELVLAQIGPQLIRLELTELLARAEQVSTASMAAIAKEVASKGRVVEPTEEDFERSFRLYQAFRSLVTDHGLQVVGVRCWPELRFQHRFTPCLAFALLMDEGIMGVCENDPAAGITMLVGHWFSGEPVFLGDISRMDPDENTLSLWHCGAASTNLACPTCRIEFRHSRSAPLGIQAEFPLRPGRVTLVKLSRPSDGRAQLFITTGEAVETTPVRGNVIEIRLDDPVDHVMQTILSRGIEHHLVATYGDYSSHFKHLAHLLELEFVTPTSRNINPTSMWW